MSSTPTTPKRTWRRKLAFAGLLLGLLVGVGLVATELLLRAFGPDLLGVAGQLRGYYRVDGKGGMEPVPGWQGTMTIHGRTVPIRVDALGMRATESAVQTAAAQRVLFLGDSMVFGNGVTADEAFPALVGKSLGVTAGNAGVPGYGPRLALRRLRELDKAFAPHAIVATVFLGNDFDDDCQRSYAVVDGYWFFGPMARLANQSWRLRMATRSRLWFTVENYLRQSGSPWAMSLDAPPSAEEAAASAGFPSSRIDGSFLDLETPTPWVDRALDTTLESLLAMRDLAGKRPFVVLLMPLVFQLDDQGYRSNLERQKLDPALHRRGITQARLLERCTKAAITTIDLTAVLEREVAAKHEVHIPGDWHLNQRGHEIVAQEVAKVLGPLLRR